MKNILVFLIGITLTIAHGNETIHLELIKESKGLLDSKKNAITLEQAKEMAAGENVDVKIAYEKVYQAQQKIYKARAEYFPYGAGDVAALYLTNFWTPLILAELVSSAPSKWFNIKSHKHLRNAQAHNLTALRENLKNQMAHLYYSILKEETALRLIGFEVRLYEELIRGLKAQERAGMATMDEVHKAEMKALTVRGEYFKFSSYLAQSKAAVKIALNLPYYVEDYELQPVKTFLTDKLINIDPQRIVLTSLERSHEVKAAWEMINATADRAVSAKWSILSFQGFGFNYMARVRYAQGAHQQAIYQKEALERNIHNEVYLREGALRNSIAMLKQKLAMASQSKRFMESQLAAYKAGELDAPSLIKADIFFVRDYRNAINGHYNSLIRLDDLERIFLGNMDSLYSHEQIKVASAQDEDSFSLYIQTDVPIEEITSVTYTLSDNENADFKVFNPDTNFRAKVGHGKREIKGHVTIFFRNGETLKETFSIDSL